jgi:hypothetical protein
MQLHIRNMAHYEHPLCDDLIDFVVAMGVAEMGARRHHEIALAPVIKQLQMSPW